MAKDKIGEALESVHEPYNSKARLKIKHQCAVAMRDIKAKRKELNEEMADIRTRLRDNQMDPKALEAAMRVWDMDDENARDTFLTELQESYESLGAGGQMDWIATLGEKTVGNSAAEGDAFEDDGKGVEDQGEGAAAIG